MNQRRNGYFSLELALTVALFLPAAICIFDTMRYLISHTILNRAVVRIAAMAEKEGLSLQQIGDHILKESSILLPVRGFSCTSQLVQTESCCDHSEPSCLTVSLVPASAPRHVTAVYNVEYMLLDTLLGSDPSASPLLRGELAVSSELWRTTESPEVSRVENGILEEVEDD